MNNSIKIILIILSFMSLVVCSIWLYKSPGFDSGSAALVSLIAFLGLFLVSGNDGKGNLKMSQKAGDNSNLYQSGGDMNIKK
jgi:hypothetical protein